MKQDVEIRNEQFLIKQLETIEEDPFTLYLNGLAPSGRRSMKSQLIGVLRLMNYSDDPASFPWAKLRYVHVNKIRNILLDNGKATNTVNTTVAAINGVIRTAFNMGMISADDYMRVKLIKRVNGKRIPVGRELKQSEIKKMIACCKRDRNALGIRDAAIIALMVSTGLRRSEVVSLYIEDCDLKNGSLKVKQGKGGSDRGAFIVKSAKKLVMKWVKLRGVSKGVLFTRIKSEVPTHIKLTHQSIYNIVRTRSEQAGIKKCTPHDLRRTLVTWLLDIGVDINRVRQIVGHQDINTTARYDKRDNEIKGAVFSKLDIF